MFNGILIIISPGYDEMENLSQIKVPYVMIVFSNQNYFNKIFNVFINTIMNHTRLTKIHFINLNY